MLNKPKMFDFSEFSGFCAFLVRSSSICVPKVAQILPKVARILPKVAPNPGDFGFGQIRIQVRNLLVVQCKFSKDTSLPRIPLYSTRFSRENLLPAVKFLGPGP